MEAYLDIETTGLSPYSDDITVVGVSFGDLGNTEVIQLVEKEVGASALKKILKGSTTLYTYNGTRFDLPFIRERLGLDLEALLEHHDLMYDCWSCGLYGGLKAVEKVLRIPRMLPDIDGRQAVRLWWDFVRRNDLEALSTLLQYNREDVLNLKRVAIKLERLMPYLDTK